MTSQYPVYSPPEPAPPRRRNPGMVAVVAAGIMVGATAIAVTIATSGGESTPSGNTLAASPANRPITKLPPGCKLLTGAQVAGLIPGEVDTSRSSGPVDSNELIQSECEWGNWRDPNSASLPYVDLHVVVTVAATQETLDNTMHYSLGCGNPVTSPPVVNGADQTCVTNSVTDPTGAPINQADVTARRGMLVVEVHYNYDGMPINKVNTTATETAATVISTILKMQ